MDEKLRQLVNSRVSALSDFLIQTRRDIHAHPELGNQEERTPALVVRVLKEIGLELKERVGGTGVVAVLRGSLPGPTLALRADMDALPLDEEADRPYRSTVPGVMHACGHDAHVAMALGAAKVLHFLKDRLHGNVKFLFQPAEETYGGASEMIAEGCLTDDPAVDAAFGLHVEPLGAVGELRLRSGAIMASADALRILVKGKGGHASTPHDCIDPVAAGAHVITNLQALITRRLDARIPVVVTITYVQGGSAFNVIPSEAVLAGTVRTVDPSVRAALPGRIEELVHNTCAAFGATAEVNYVHGSGVVVNQAGFTEFVRQVIGDAGGNSKVVEMEHPLMEAEDFGLYLEQVPGTFAFLGACPSHQEPYPCHHPQFDIDERALPIGVEVLSIVALEYLGGRRT